MDSEAYATEDRPASEMDNLFAELYRAHELISNLESRLRPVTHAKLQDKAQLAGGETAVKSEHHISQAVSLANAIGNRINDLQKSLAV